MTSPHYHNLVFLDEIISDYDMRWTSWERILALHRFYEKYANLEDSSVMYFINSIRSCIKKDVFLSFWFGVMEGNETPLDTLCYRGLLAIQKLESYDVKPLGLTPQIKGTNPYCEWWDLYEEQHYLIMSDAFKVWDMYLRRNHESSN